MNEPLMDKIKKAADNLVTLEIITAVGNVALQTDKKPDIDFSQNPKVILTKIDLLQGDITTIFNEEYVTGSYQSLRDFHAAREKQGHEIVEANIAALTKLFELAKTL